MRRRYARVLTASNTNRGVAAQPRLVADSSNIYARAHAAAPAPADALRGRGGHAAQLHPRRRAPARRPAGALPAGQGCRKPARRAAVVFVQEARRVLNAADRVVTRTQAAGRGEHGVVRVAYTLMTVYGTLPAIIDGLAKRHPSL